MFSSLRECPSSNTTYLIMNKILIINTRQSFYTRLLLLMICIYIYVKHKMKNICFYKWRLNQKTKINKLFYLTEFSVNEIRMLQINCNFLGLHI